LNIANMVQLYNKRICQRCGFTMAKGSWAVDTGNGLICEVCAIFAVRKGEIHIVRASNPRRDR